MVKAGYKQTEVGEIPEDWETFRIDDYAIKVGSGITPKGGSSVYKITGRPFVRSQNVGWGDLRLDDLAFIDEQTHSTFQGTEIREGDVLLNITGASIGRCAVANKNLSGGNVNQHVCIVRMDKSIDQSFLSYLLNASLGQKQIDSFQAGGNREGLNFGQIRSFLFPKPPTECEQTAIAAALSDVDELIASLERLIEKKRDIKTGTMQQLLTGKKRLPGFDGKWCHTEIGNHIDLLTGFPFPSSGYTSSGVRLLRGSNIKRGQLDWSDELVKFWPKVDGDIAKYALQNGDIVVAMDGSLVGRSFGQISKSDLPALLLQRVARVRSKGIDQGLMKEWICSPFFTEHCDNVKTVTAIPHISPEDILKFRIHVSEDLEEQKAIAAFLAASSNELCILETRLAKTKAIKQGVMQELLTGRTRLV